VNTFQATNLPPGFRIGLHVTLFSDHLIFISDCVNVIYMLNCISRTERAVQKKVRAFFGHVFDTVKYSSHSVMRLLVLSGVQYPLFITAAIGR
jgi:hypothetical protein